jgi:hypothetical protein
VIPDILYVFDAVPMATSFGAAALAPLPMATELANVADAFGPTAVAPSHVAPSTPGKLDDQ